MPRGIPNRKLEEMGPHIVDQVSRIQEDRERVFMQCLRDVISTVKLYSDDQLRRKIGPEKLTDLTLQFFSYMENGAGDLMRNEQLALGYQLVKCIQQYMLSIKVPVTINTIVDRMDLLEYAVDLSFPGYSNSSLLRYIISPTISKVV